MTITEFLLSPSFVTWKKLFFLSLQPFILKSSKKTRKEDAIYLDPISFVGKHAYIYVDSFNTISLTENIDVSSVTIITATTLQIKEYLFRHGHWCVYAQILHSFNWCIHSVFSILNPRMGYQNITIHFIIFLRNPLLMLRLTTTLADRNNTLRSISTARSYP